MPKNDEKILEEIMKNLDDISEPTKSLIQKYLKRAYYFESELKVHKKVILKDGSESIYYMVPVPNESVKYGKLKPDIKYRFEVYPAEE